jgi:RNA recognition motif-containing protein
MQFLSLYVKGFNSMTTSPESLHQYFSNFGEIKTLKITPTGAVLISYADRECARTALEKANGAHFNGNTLSVAYFEPREIRSIHQQERQDSQALEDKRQRELMQTPVDASLSSILTAFAAILSLNQQGNARQASYNGGYRGG